MHTPCAVCQMLIQLGNAHVKEPLLFRGKSHPVTTHYNCRSVWMSSDQEKSDYRSYKQYSVFPAAPPGLVIEAEQDTSPIILTCVFEAPKHKEKEELLDYFFISLNE